MNKKLVTISAKFASKADYLNQSPASVKYFYEFDGKPLNSTHAKKVERIAGWFAENDRYPVFVPLVTVTDESKDIEAEAWIDLNLWTNTNPAKPRFNMTDLNTGKRSKGASGNRSDIQS